MIPAFSISGLPRILFGEGRVEELPARMAEFGSRALLVTGAKSFRASPRWTELCQALAKRDIAMDEFTVSGEPSPDLVDEAVQRFRAKSIDVVVGIGGGSVLDAAKAIAGLLRPGNSVRDHLEGVGPQRPYCGPATPFIAVPTTAGTGSEATKNAVLSVQGAQGFKKSFRDERLVPRYALVDPTLLAGCPRPLIAANGMDAFTQLLESYVSSQANPLSDALAWSGLKAARDGLLAWYEDDSAAGRSRMAYAALISGITLAQVGLGSVHGLAAPLGAFFPIPHGVVCGTLLAAATDVNIRALQARRPDHAALAKYARVANLLTGHTFPSHEAALAALVDTLNTWTQRLALPRLHHYGLGRDAFAHIVAHARGNSMKTNPIVLSDQEIEAVLAARL